MVRPEGFQADGPIAAVLDLVGERRLDFPLIARVADGHVQLCSFRQAAPVHDDAKERVVRVRVVQPEEDGRRGVFGHGRFHFKYLSWLPVLALNDYGTM